MANYQDVYNRDYTEGIHHENKMVLISHLHEKQATAFLEDAQEYRSVEHKIDEIGLKLYRHLYSRYWRLIIWISIVALHALVLFEEPSSLTLRSVVNGTSEAEKGAKISNSLLLAVEGLLAILILADTICHIYLHGVKFLQTPWIVAFVAVMAAYCLDYLISLALPPTIYFFRARRFLRPFFAIQRSQMMKKVLKSLSKTAKDIFSAFVVLVVWLLAFTVLAMSFFTGFEKPEEYSNGYRWFYESFFNLLVLLTTANNPDAMVPVYNRNRFTFLFFLLFMSVGIFVIMNILMAIIFDNFRSHVLESMKTSLLRRRIAIRAMFEVLKTSSRKYSFQQEIDAEALQRVIEKSSLEKWRKVKMIQELTSSGKEIIDWTTLRNILQCLDEFKNLTEDLPIPKFSSRNMIGLQNFILSKSFNIIGLSMCFANVFVVAVYDSLDNEYSSKKEQQLVIFNWAFLIFFITEQTLKCVTMGRATYFSKGGCIVDFLITAAILVLKIAELILVMSSIKPNTNIIIGLLSVSDISRITNLLVLIRAVKIVQFLPMVFPIINTLFDIPKRLKSIFGILLALFYFYALLGMNIFRKTITPKFMLNNTECGTYQQLNYGGFHFDDFYSSVVVLWCLLIINNWHVFMVAFSEASGGNRWVHLYMISWWILAVVVVLNCVTAFVIEAYVQWKSFYENDRKNSLRSEVPIDVQVKPKTHFQSTAWLNESITFHMLFRNDLREPTEEELIDALKQSYFLCKSYPHIAHSNYIT